MITGAKVGAIIGRKRAFAIGCVIYGCGSLTTALAPNLPVLLLGWSFLEGVGAALILPAIVALVASNFPAERRPAAYGLVAAAGAVAVAVGPLIGGFATTYFSWRWVFAGEVVVVLAILVLARRIADSPATEQPKLDLVGAGLSALGLGLFVFGILRSGEWGWIQPQLGRPELGRALAGDLADPRRPLRPLDLLPLGGPASRRTGESRSFAARCSGTSSSSGGLTMFFFQYLVQAGIFFVVPLYLSVALGLSAIDTGVRHPAALDHAAGRRDRRPAPLPERLAAARRPQRPARAASPGTVVLLGALDVDAGPEIVLRAAAPDRARDRRARLAARRRHRLGGARRPEPPRSAASRTR